MLDLVAVLKCVGREHHVTADHLKDLLQKIEGLLVEELRVGQEAFVVCAHNIRDPSGHVLLDLSEANL